jgi:hypothetical protein
MDFFTFWLRTRSEVLCTSTFAEISQNFIIKNWVTDCTESSAEFLGRVPCTHFWLELKLKASQSIKISATAHYLTQHNIPVSDQFRILHSTNSIHVEIFQSTPLKLAYFPECSKTQRVSQFCRFTTVISKFGIILCLDFLHNPRSE